MPIPQPLLETLRCPQCQCSLVEDGERLVCTDRETRVAYPVRDGIPVMIVAESMTLSPEEWEAVMGRQQSKASS